MAVVTNESDIQKAADELFVDTADGSRLNIVGANLGLDRPKVGIGDDEWRAVLRAIALQQKIVRNAFFRVIEICLGPQFARVAVLAQAAIVGDTVIIATDVSTLVQLGTLVIDPGLATEETVSYTFVNRTTGEVFLSAPLAHNHGVVAPASSNLVSDVTVGAVSLVLNDSSGFPTSGFPYSVLLDRGTEQEEAVSISANTVGTNTLTCSPTVFTHPGPHSAFLRHPLAAPAVVGRNFLVLNPGDTRSFPVGSFIKVDAGGGSEELCIVEQNDTVNSILTVKKPLRFNHATGKSVDLMKPGALVDTATLWEKGVYWDLLETTDLNITLFVPASSIAALRRTDGSWFHGAIQPPFSTTTSAFVNPPDTTISLFSTAGLPAAGMIIISGVQILFYTKSPTTPNVVDLGVPAGASYGIGAVVQLYQLPYAGTLLEDGNIFTTLGAIRPDHFIGYYLFDLTQDAPSGRVDTLTVLVLPWTKVAASSGVGQTCLEVLDVSLWPAPAFTPFVVRIGANSGFQEDRTVVDRSLKSAAITTTTGNVIGQFVVNCVTTVPFAQSDGVNPAGYRVVINPGGGNQEIVTVLQNDRGANTLHIQSPLVFNHIAGEIVRQLNDVLQFDPLTEPHAGPHVTPTRDGNLVQPFTTQLSLGSAGSFPSDGGTVWLNFGSELPSTRHKIIAFPAGNQVQLTSSADLPGGGFPYQVVVGEGTANQELAQVTANNPATGTLTFSAALALTHHLNDYVAFDPGPPETATYQSKSGNNLIFTPPVILASKHVVQTRVMFSPGPSDPTLDGTSYPFRLPPDPFACLKLLVELVRAAGVQVQIVTTR